MDKNIVRLMELWDQPITKEKELEARLLTIALARKFVEEAEANGKVHPEIHQIMSLASPKVMTTMMMGMFSITMEDV